MTPSKRTGRSGDFVCFFKGSRCLSWVTAQDLQPGHCAAAELLKAVLQVWASLFFDPPFEFSQRCLICSQRSGYGAQLWAPLWLSVSLEAAQAYGFSQAGVALHQLGLKIPAICLVVWLVTLCGLVIQVAGQSDVGFGKCSLMKLVERLRSTSACCLD